ncbi:transglutaminase family protein [Microlunatus panaciterrae]|uniref:Transglutaminase-like putative cysteine protease n=1 Tax=Microlunatus panaciterrae TaxID=400768 RepID=A0ABS2RIG7_9ACTN|nr:transglutaminase family protein [Microlunatus panaciterrae]MBM7798786.1 transglutaminase-like putative cysteine protease [Microlunatus panaciterrae]
MRLSIDHTTGFSYSSPVASSYNEARMVPTTSQNQTVWSSRISIDPTPWSFSYLDYWGTRVTAFELHQPHQRLTVQAESVVETRGDGSPWDEQRLVAEDDLGWSALRDPGVIASMTEFLTITDRTAPPEELAQLTRDVVAGQPPRLAALDVCRLIADRLSYQKGATAVTSTAREVWEGGRGVCQDFSHVTLGALRAVGVPARYVSGYLYPGSGEPNHKIIGESHSWVEWWCGSWAAFDPSTQRRISDHYVRVGHGRDYADVAPLRGTYSGGASTMFVTVEMTQLG